MGAGVLGARVAREIVSEDDDATVALVSSRPERRAELARSFGRSVLIVEPGGDTGAELPSSVEVVVLCGEDSTQAEAAHRHIREGRHVVSTADSPETVAALLSLGPRAEDAGLCLSVGTAFSPGLSCLLAAQAAGWMDRVDEIHVARHGAAGPSCARRRLSSLRDRCLEWRDGEWLERSSGSGRELAWFPDPIGGRDCFRASSAEPLLLVDAVPGLDRATVRAVMNRRDVVARLAPVWIPAPAEGGMGAIRVEVRGRIGTSRETVVLGALDRPGVAAAAVVAEVVAAIRRGEAPLGAHGLAAWADPSGVLVALRRRGVRVARLVGD